METGYQNEIVEIVQRVLNLTMMDEKTDLDMDLKNVGLDSLKFVRIVVEVEDRFGIEFPDEKLDLSQADTVRKLCEIVMESAAISEGVVL